MNESPQPCLDPMKRCLSYSLRSESYRPYELDAYGARWTRPLRPFVRAQLRRRDLLLVQPIPYDSEKRANGRDWPAAAHTMIGLRRLDNIQAFWRKA